VEGYPVESKRAELPSASRLPTVLGHQWNSPVARAPYTRTKSGVDVVGVLGERVDDHYAKRDDHHR
jgi:hypothetical protein